MSEAEPKRTNNINIRLTDEENERLRAEATKRGLSLTQYIVRRCAGGPTIDERIDEILDKLSGHSSKD